MPKESNCWVDANQTLDHTPIQYSRAFSYESRSGTSMRQFTGVDRAGKLLRL